MKTVADVREYRRFSEALADLDDGGTLLIPTGTYGPGTEHEPDALRPTRKIRVRGDGPAHSWVQLGPDPGWDFLRFDVLDWVSVSGLSIVGAGVPGSGRGIVLDGCSWAHLSDLLFWDMPSLAIETETERAKDSLDLRIERVRSVGNQSRGCIRIGPRQFHPLLYDCTLSCDRGYGLSLGEASMPTVRDTGFHHIVSAETPALMVVDGARQAIVDGCWFEAEDSGGNAGHSLIRVTGAGGRAADHRFRDLRFVRTGPGVASTRAMRFTGYAASTLESLSGVTSAPPSGSSDIVQEGDGRLLVIGDLRVANAAETSVRDMGISARAGVVRRMRWQT